MANQIISTPDAPQDDAYSQAIRAGDTIYVAGTTGIDVTTGTFAGPTIHDQVRQAIVNCETIIRAGGGELSDVVMIHVLLTRSEDAAGVTDVINQYFAVPRPARCVSKIGVDRPGLLVSLAMVAVVSE